MGLQVYSTLSRKKETFETIEPHKVRMYVCGPTVYDKAHVGHAMSALVFDIIRRYLQYRGYEVKLVMNYTDVDDKIINRANKMGRDPFELAETYIQQYAQHMKDLNILPATVNPRATREMDEILKLISDLIDKGYAYPAGGDVYYRVEKKADYGKLSGRKLDDMRAGARIEVDERKENPLDFALWKAAKEGEPAWDSPWGKGPPRLAHRVLGHERRPPGRADRHPRRRERSDLPAPRERDCPIRSAHRQAVRALLDPQRYAATQRREDVQIAGQPDHY